MFNGGTRKRMLHSSSSQDQTSSSWTEAKDCQSPQFDIPPLLPLAPAAKLVKQEEQEQGCPPSLPPSPYLWPHAPYHLLWPGRPLPGLPETKVIVYLYTNLLTRSSEILGFSMNMIPRLSRVRSDNPIDAGEASPCCSGGVFGSCSYGGIKTNLW